MTGLTNFSPRTSKAPLVLLKSVFHALHDARTCAGKTSMWADLVAKHESLSKWLRCELALPLFREMILSIVLIARFFALLMSVWYQQCPAIARLFADACHVGFL